MYAILMTIHVAACLLLILIVLLQAGRGAGLAVFGGGGGDSLFNAPTTTSFMKQFTMGLATTFAITSLMLALLSSRSAMRSVTTTSLPIARQAPPPSQAPAEPAPAAPKGAPEKPVKK